jgi:hypothetical protein
LHRQNRCILFKLRLSLCSTPGVEPCRVVEPTNEACDVSIQPIDIGGEFAQAALVRCPGADGAECEATLSSPAAEPLAEGPTVRLRRGRRTVMLRLNARGIQLLEENPAGVDAELNLAVRSHGRTSEKKALVRLLHPRE